MNHPSLATQVGAATNYEEAVVPALISRMGAPGCGGRWHSTWRSGLGRGLRDRRADTSCAEAVGPVGSVTGLDLDPGMLTIAARAAPSISWHRGVAENLPFHDGTFDAVVSQFGLMFFQDRSRALREMWRVLRPGGRMAVAVWASLDETQFSDHPCWYRPVPQHSRHGRRRSERLAASHGRPVGSADR
jgi:SAM-dependent methyltransferase